MNSYMNLVFHPSCCQDYSISLGLWRKLLLKRPAMKAACFSEEGHWTAYPWREGQCIF